MQQTKTHFHKHVFAVVLAVAIGVFLGLIAYPKIAYNRGERGTPGIVPYLIAESTSVGTVDLTWNAPDDQGDSPVTGYRIYYYAAEDPETIIMIETKDTSTTNVVEDLVPDREYVFFVTAYNNEGESADSESVNVIVINTEPFSFVGDITVTNTSTESVRIEWQTNQESTTTVYYGLKENYFNQSLTNAAEESVTVHTADITNLVSCSVYWYYVNSIHPDKTSIDSSVGVFKTTGCKGESAIISYDSIRVTSDSGATAEANSVSSRKIEVIVPAAPKTGVSSLTIQAQKLEKEKVVLDVSSPNGKEWVGEAYSLKAFEDESTELNNFDKNIDVSITYNDEDVVGLNESTLKIYHYEDGVGWAQLNDCTVDTELNIVTCSTSSFSIFGVFGETEDSGGGDPGGQDEENNDNNLSTISSGSQPKNIVSEEIVTLNNDIEVEKTNNKFTKNLWLGITDPEVKLLQVFLNKSGFVLDVNGPGSMGNETEYFGPKTLNALKSFQEFYKDQILIPLGLSSPTGYFGEKTRNFINNF